MPQCERLPAACIRRLVQLAEAGVRIVFTGNLPLAVDSCETAERGLEPLPKSECISIHPTHELAGVPAIAELASARIDQPHDLLRVRNYRRGGMDMFFCVNEDTRSAVDTTLRIRESRAPLCYDAMSDRLWRPPFHRVGDEIQLPLALPPSSSIFIVFTNPHEGLALQSPPPVPGQLLEIQTLAGPWQVSLDRACETGGFSPPITISSPTDLAAHVDLPAFSGIIAYETTVASPSKELWLDLGEVHGVAEVFLDGQSLGAWICPPYLFSLGEVKAGEHRLRIESATTLAGMLGDKNSQDRPMPDHAPGMTGPVRLGIADLRLSIDD